MREHEQTGPLALLGGPSATAATYLPIELLDQSNGEIVVVPTAAAYERPERLVETVRASLSRFGVEVRAAMVLSRSDAEDPALSRTIREARFCYLLGGSPLHLRSVLKDSMALSALVSAWKDGAVVAGAEAGAVALSDPMVDPRGGAFTVGLGLVRNLAIVTGTSIDQTPQLRRTIALAPRDAALLALGEGACVVRQPDGSWASFGNEAFSVYVDEQADGLLALAGKPIA